MPVSDEVQNERPTWEGRATEAGLYIAWSHVAISLQLWAILTSIMYAPYPPALHCTCSPQLRELLASNPSGLQLAVLGTASGCASQSRALGNVTLMRGKDVWVFDAGG